VTVNHQPDIAADELERQLTGPLLRAGGPGYEEARPVWNGMIDRHPALIARCATAGDVAAVVRFAAGRQVPLAVRGGGATWGVFDAATQAHGLATTGGLISTTGIGGLTLGGGIGRLVRSYGLASDNLLRAEVVTADGHVVQASETEEPDLLWGLRGGGGNFGVVTQFDYQLHPVGPTVLGGMVLYPLERAGEVLGFWREWAGQAPDALTTMVAFISAPPGPSVPEESRFPAVAVQACYAGEPADGEALVAPLRGLGEPVADLIGPMPYTALQSMLDASSPAGLRNYWKSGYIADATDLGRAQDALIDAAATRPSPLSQIHVYHLGGAVSRAGGRTAFSPLDKAFAVNIAGMWQQPADDEANLSWARRHSAALEPFTSGAYVNFLSDHGADEVRAAYPPALYDRLARIKHRYDPGNLFRLNHNITPQG
jgi:FAD/FMN-containing dehydrogenase